LGEKAAIAALPTSGAAFPPFERRYGNRSFHSAGRARALFSLTLRLLDRYAGTLHPKEPCSRRSPSMGVSDAFTNLLDAFPSKWGNINRKIVCPHCQKKGRVRTKPMKRKRGVSGAKATGGLLTGGLSILATGLSRKEKVTQAYCASCKSTWDF
jgi:hypothetical protein